MIFKFNSRPVVRVELDKEMDEVSERLENTAFGVVEDEGQKLKGGYPEDLDDIIEEIKDD